MFRTSLLTIVLCQQFIIGACSQSVNSKYTVSLESVRTCRNPQPPFAEKRSIIIKYNIYKRNGKSYLRGSTSVLEETPFKNFSIKTYNNKNGKKELQHKFANLNCGNFVGRTFLIIANFDYSKQTCMLHKGFSEYRDLDLDKITHGLPNWHGEGDLIHELSLVHGGYTIFCQDVLVAVKTLK